MAYIKSKNEQIRDNKKRLDKNRRKLGMDVGTARHGTFYAWQRIGCGCLHCWAASTERRSKTFDEVVLALLDGGDWKSGLDDWCWDAKGRKECPSFWGPIATIKSSADLTRPRTNRE